MTYLLPFELTNGNDGRGHRWFNSSKVRKALERTLIGFRRDQPYGYPVKVTVCRILGRGQRLWDSSSVGRGNWKEAEDALVALGWFIDDGPRYITLTDFRQDSSRREEGPAVEVTIEQDGEPWTSGKK